MQPENMKKCQKSRLLYDAIMLNDNMSMHELSKML